MKAAAFVSCLAPCLRLPRVPASAHRSKFFAANQPIVINEIQYYPANDDDRLQYIELHNPGAAEVDLSGWKLRG